MSSISVVDCQGNLDSGVSHLLAMYAKSTAKEIADGRAWYAMAHEEAIYISATYDVPLLTVIKVACALSPRLKWEDNMSAAEAVIRWFVAGGFVPDIQVYKSRTMLLQRTRHSMDTPVLADDVRLPSIKGPTKVNISKALWILQGHIEVLRGAKVSSFCDNILNHATSNAVTVDSHAIQCWFGRVEKGTYCVPPSMYAIVAADYRKAAAIVGLSPLQFQAVTWLTKKRLSKGAKRANPRAVVAAASTVIAAVEKMLA